MKGASDLADFAFALRDLAAAYHKPASTVDERMVSAYVDGLEDVPLAQVLEAMKLAKRESRFFPSVATIRECARLVRQSSPALAVAKPVLRPDEYCCGRCGDTGWVYLDGQKREYPSLEAAVMAGARTVTPCRCRASNPAYQYARSQDRGVASREQGTWG